MNLIEALDMKLFTVSSTAIATSVQQINIISRLTFTCSKSTRIETLGKGVKYVQS